MIYFSNISSLTEKNEVPFLFSLTQKFPFVIKAMLYKKKTHTSLKEELEWEIMAKRLKVANPARCICCNSLPCLHRFPVYEGLPTWRADQKKRGRGQSQQRDLRWMWELHRSLYNRSNSSGCRKKSLICKHCGVCTKFC